MKCSITNPNALTLHSAIRLAEREMAGEHWLPQFSLPLLFAKSSCLQDRADVLREACTKSTIEVQCFKPDGSAATISDIYNEGKEKNEILSVGADGLAEFALRVLARQLEMLAEEAELNGK